MSEKHQHNNHMTKSPSPKTDALREVIIGQYKEDELTGDGMGNLLAALTDIEMLGRERSEALEELAKWKQLSVEADKRFVEAIRERDEARAKANQLSAALTDAKIFIRMTAKRMNDWVNETNGCSIHKEK